MDRRQFGENYYGRHYQGSPFFNPGGQKSAEEELVARSKEWMNRQDRDRDQWRRSVDDFLDDKSSSRYHKSRDRSRERSRSRERGERKERKRSRERSRERESSRRWSPEDDERDTTNTRRRHERGEVARRGSDDRKDRHGQEWSKYRGEEKPESSKESSSSSRRHSKDEDEEKKWSSDDDMSTSGFERMEGDFDKPYSDFSLRPEDRFVYKKQVPQRTIIIRGLAQHITEQDIQDDITLSHLVCKDIRLVRRKDTGTSRGFAFVEFSTVGDAIKWIELKQGELMLKDHFRALLQYSLPKDYSFGREKYMSDWYCKCQAHNFRRRNTCFKCNLSRREVEVEFVDTISSYPTNTVLLTGLDVSTTEESVLQSIKTLSSLPIRSVRIGRDIATNTSRGVCYLEMNSVVDAMYLHNALQASTPSIDGRTALVSYAKLDPVSMNSSAAISVQIANAAVAAAQWSHQKSDSQQYQLSDVPRLAEYSAALYATTPQEKASYLAYYEEYYRKQITEGENISLPVNSSSGLATAQAAVAAHKKSKDSSSKLSPLTEAPDGSGDKTYPAPDVTSYQYDKSSGYYYDPHTTLYYDANSQYYYNNKLGKFLYWDASRCTYLPSPTDKSQPQNQSNNSPQVDAANKEEEKKNKEKETEKDKVKVAKRIAKDMERWAKTLNQKKENAKQNIVQAQAAITSMKAAGAADIGYAVLERKDLALPTQNGADRSSKNESLVAAYGQGSDSEEEAAEESANEEKMHTDWIKLACLLCKRQFASKDALVKHQQLSDLHKQNLSAWYKSKGLDPHDAQTRNTQYRDRARERRMKYGEPDTPQPSKLKETYMKSREATINYEEPTRAGIGADNLGNKLLQKMGWQEGMGLGKSNQGRTCIIQAERRSACAGLGTKSVGVTPGPGETYKDCVKKMMQIRYSEIDDPS
ncbi:RNA-binding protein 5 [Cimex lectularius]|uniref:RNA-binding protein 5 n=1 Tax=Cimex lectularius TaxID=79782 RepID=A0A8I6RWZ3_CIMLE|nr:RNA-binding protein 5 [Cimex lectularius]